MGLLLLRSGTIPFQGRDITRLPTHERAGLGIGYAPEGCAIFPELTVAENLQISRWLAAAKGRQGSAGQHMDERILSGCTPLIEARSSSAVIRKPCLPIQR
jgi:urea transport system ATP-binding protein